MPLEIKVAKPSGESAQILAKITKEKGPGVAFMANELRPQERIPTGVFEFDFGTNGGFPKNRLSIVYGTESSGKTNLCYGLIRTVQSWPDSEPNKVVLVDLEGTSDPEWMVQFGIDLTKLILVKPGYGEEAADVIDALIAADDVGLVLVDSIAVLTSAREVDASTEKADVGTSPMLVKRICNKLAMSFSRENRRGHWPTVVFINQRRFKVGVMFGDPESQPGGETMKFMSSLTVRLYGKNKMDKTVHPDIPAYKDTSVIIKKAKVKVNAVEFKYDMALVPQPEAGLLVGDTDSWNMVAGYLKEDGELTKATGSTQGWVLWGEKYPTLVLIRQKYYSDPHFKRRCQQAVIARRGGKAKTVEYKVDEPEQAA